MLAPLPRWATTVRPRAACGATSGSTLAMYSYEARGIAAHAPAGDRLGQRERLGHRGLRAVECRVEAGHLLDAGLHRFEDANRRQVVRLMQRRERRELVQLGHDLGRDAHRAAEALAAMHDAMAHRRETMPFLVSLQERGDLLGFVMAERLDAGPLLLVMFPVMVDGTEVRGGRVKPIDLTVHDQPERVALHVERGKLDARRAGIQHQNHVRHAVTPRARPLHAAHSRRASRPRMKPAG